MHKQVEVVIDNKVINIDIGCVNLVMLFNKEGLKTKHCCQGDYLNEFCIMFDNSVTDEMIKDFISRFVDKHGHSFFLGKFSKWSRMVNNQFISNWIFTAANLNFAEITYKRILDKI